MEYQNTREGRQKETRSRRKTQFVRNIWINPGKALKNYMPGT